ncbi:uncharacterized protein LOC114945273 isoform X2 [Nylanderia fulva]|uniref:uncharacterized protein LOC114945273 isoform X2 n=1 Tax=Nylanderia fulva TaxID=613905 RepID=UPI0010FB8CF3|nr:uncharacterized protein LOC114945273 isoform X2 [Nylanderia fulva]
MTFDNNLSHITMFKRPESTTKDCHTSVKRARLDSPNSNPENKKVQYDDLWGDDFAEEDIEEMDMIASQAYSQTSNTLDNAKPSGSGLHLMKPDFSERPFAVACNETSRLKLSRLTGKADLCVKKDIPSRSQDVADINYSQFRNNLISTESHNSTFQKGNNIIVPDNKELEKLKNENKKLLNDFITKDGETVYLRQQVQQIQLRTENEKLEKMRLIEEQANTHRLEINKICKEKEQLKTQLELQSLEIGNLQERCKRLESRNIKLEEPQSLYMNTSFNKSKCNTSINRLANTNKNQVKDVCVQANIYKKVDHQLQTYGTYFPLTGISELMFEASLPEKPIVNIKVIEKTGRRNLPILQEEETFRIFENPDLVKPVITMVNEKKLTIQFVLPEIAIIERKANNEIESEKCIPIINKLVLTTRELMLNVVKVLQMIFQAMRNDDIRDMNDLYFSNVYENHNICIKSECEANAWHEGERGIEARRLLGVLSYISLESSYLSNYLAGKSLLCTRNDECYNRFLPQMTRYNAWSKKNHEFEILEIILECVTLIGRVRRSHQFTGLINAIIKVLCNVQRKVGYCKKGLEYICLIFKQLVFSRPLSLCYISLVDFLMIFSKCYIEFVPKLCSSSQSVKNWKGILHFTPDACVLQILILQLEHFNPDFLTIVNISHGLISSVWDILQTNNNLLRIENSDSCNCYMKLLRVTINMLKKSSETKLDIIDNTEWQNLLSDSKKCYSLKKVNYKNYTCQTECSEQNMEKHLSAIYLEKLDKNFWLGIKKIQHKVLKQGIRFLSHLVNCNPEFLTRSSDIEDMFNLFIRNIAFFDDLILHENEREALDIIKSTLFNKSIQNEVEIPHEEIHIHQLNIRNVKKKIIPGTKRVETVKDYNRTYMTIKALYNSKTEYKDKL